MKMLDFKGKELRVAFPNWTEAATFVRQKPFDYEFEDSELGGVEMDILRYFARAMNFEIKLVPSVDGNWGSLNEDGKWNGMIGMLERKVSKIVSFNAISSSHFENLAVF